MPEAVELERALLRAQRGDLKSIETGLWAAAEQDPSEAPMILEALVKGFLKNYRWPQALKCLHRWLELQPNNPRALFLSGRFHESVQLIPDASECYQRVIEQDPENVSARVRLGLMLLLMSDPAEAAEQFESVVARQPEDADALTGLARCRLEMGHPEEASELLDRALAQRPTHVLGLIERGKAARALGHPGQAEQWLRKALDLAPNERQANYVLGFCLREQRLTPNPSPGNPGEGRVREADAVNARLEQIEALEQRLSQLMRKMMETPQDFSLRQEIGTLLLRNGQTEDGIGWLKGILQENPNYDPARQALASYYESTGKGGR